MSQPPKQAAGSATNVRQAKRGLASAFGPQILHRAYTSLTRRGPRRSFETLLSMAEDALFDLRLGTDTTAIIEQSALDVLSPEHQAKAKPYVMTRARVLRRAFEHSTAPRDKNFIDIGSGKGKVVITAALAGFKHVIGIEFAPELVDIAQSNLAKVKQHLPPDTTVEMVCADATRYMYGPDDCVFFLYNPFAGAVMRGFCEQLACSLRMYPRKLWIIYADPAFIDVMRSFLPLHESSRLTYGGFEIVFLNHEPAASEQVLSRLVKETVNPLC